MEVGLFILLIFTASLLQTSTGFGFSIVATPFLLLLFDARDAIQLNLILSLFISLTLFKNIRSDIDRGVLKRFISGSVIGLPIGMMVFSFSNIDYLKIAIGILILLLTVLLLLKFRIGQTRGRDRIVGAISGSLTTSIGMPGPPLLLYFSGTETEKAKLRGTTLAYYLFIYFFSLVVQIFAAGTSNKVWLYALCALPIVLLGQLAGQYLFSRINQKMFQLFTYAILLFTGAYLLFNT
ncbi:MULTISPECIES: sulfite exporter TauE/SafE family protein [Sporosarcina]|uniref:Probable membrane transporter protein n=1 Tax=Sporosarcina contaminans TaxID=633403 RepID=A0ABW3U067_9BACL